MQFNKIPLRHRLYFKQAKYMLLIALGLGFLFSGWQITQDYFDTCQEAQRTAMEVLDIGTTPAMQAVYNLDVVLAQEVVNGISKYRMFHYVSLENEYDQVMAEHRRTLAETQWAWLAQNLFKNYRHYQVKLTDNEHEYGILKADVDIYLLAESFVKRTRLTILFGLSYALLLAGFFYWILRILITRPLTELSTRLTQIDPDNPEKLRLSVPQGHAQDELGCLATTANQLLFSIEEKVAAQAKLNEELEQRVAERTQDLAQANLEITSLNKRLKAENLRMGTELEITRQLQQMVLPKAHELKQIKDLDIACFMQPATEVGGDYYDVLQDNGVVKIGIGDVTGHGLESGVVMLMVQMAVRTLLAHNVEDPRRFLNAINRALYGNVQRMETDKNLTLALLDYQSGLLRLSGQHEEILLVKYDGSVQCIDTLDLGFMVGLQEDISNFVTHQEIHLEVGDGVVLYTDGVTEAFNLQGDCYGLKRLSEIVSQHWVSNTAAAVREAIIDDVKQHLGGKHPLDDITLLVIKQREMALQEAA